MNAHNNSSAEISREPGFREILEYVKKFRAVDFAYYRPQTIRRRIERRLYATNLKSFEEYLAYLSSTPKELDLLIEALTIKVSHFFRNPFVFEALRELVLPGLIDKFGQGIRVWSAGSARGEEAYSMAILLKETAGTYSGKSFIIGTDIDRESLEAARKAVYKPETLLEVKKGYLDKYFERQEGLYRLKDDIKDSVTFAYHDVTTCSPPKEGVFADYHLILCRNVLIYFERDTHEKVLRSLASLLPEGACLVIGEAETLPIGTRGVTEVIPGVKIFRRASS